MGSEPRFETREFDAYQEVIEDVLGAYPPEQRLAGLTPEQRLAGLTSEQIVIALPEDILRGLSPGYLVTLSDATRAAIAKRFRRR
jgi:hypothetical protein